jgi:hypothetical protein
MKKVGIALVVAACALLLFQALTSPGYARAHPHLDPAMVAQYASPWPAALESAYALAGIMLALVPLRRGERWAWCTLLVMWIVPLVTRLATDPRCLVVLDPHQHGCHSLMIAGVLAIVGLALSWR